MKRELRNVRMLYALNSSLYMAEREGFEPPELSLNGFQDRRLKPLGHLSGFTDCLNRSNRLTGPLRYSFRPAHVRPEHFGDDHAPVCLLIVLQDGHHGPADREARAVQGMHKLRFFAAF